MVIFDYIIILSTILFSIIGSLRGFSSQLLSFLSWSSFLYIIFFHLELFTDVVSNYLPNLDYNFIRIITISLLVIVTLIIIFFLNLTIAKILESTLFVNSNKFFGFVTSLIKSQIYIFIFILVILDTSFHDTFFMGSKIVPYYLELIEYISDYDDSLFNTLEI